MKALKTVTAYRCWGLESLLPNISKLSSKAAAVPRSLRVRRLRPSARWEIKPPKDEVQQRSNFHNCGNRINLTLIFGDTVVINQPHCKPVGWPQIAHCNHDNVIFIATSAQITRFSVYFFCLQFPVRCQSAHCGPSTAPRGCTYHSIAFGCFLFALTEKSSGSMRIYLCCSQTGRRLPNHFFSQNYAFPRFSP